MPNINTLVHDIEQVLLNGAEVSDELIQKFSTNLAITIKEALSKRERKATLRMSNIGQPCERKLWYEINLPDKAEPLRPEAYMKFMFGHIAEELLLFLAEVAGHEVTGRQDEVQIQGIKGHKDAIISGTLTDVKSASQYSFQKFKNGLQPEDDSFGYLTQIHSYFYASKEDEALTNKEQAGFLVVDKTLGHITLDLHNRSDVDFDKVFAAKKEVVKLPSPPERGFTDEPEGKSGNRKLGVNCSYCPFKKTCFPGLRTFAYAKGPVFLTKVMYEPNVPEIK